MLLRALMILPNGVEVMSASLPGLMQTSLNLGILYMREDGLHLTYLIRFSIASQMEMLVQRLRAIVETAHGEMAELSSYPAGSMPVIPLCARLRWLLTGEHQWP
mgnify:CR=1 FL=1